MQLWVLLGALEGIFHCSSGPFNFPVYPPHPYSSLQSTHASAGLIGVCSEKAKMLSHVFKDLTGAEQETLADTSYCHLGLPSHCSGTSLCRHCLPGTTALSGEASILSNHVDRPSKMLGVPPSLSLVYPLAFHLLPLNHFPMLSFSPSLSCCDFSPAFLPPSPFFLLGLTQS